MALTIESQYCSPACGQKAYKIRKREQKRNEELQQVIEGLDSDRDFITVPEAIALFAVGRQTLYHYIRSGKIPSVNLGQRLTRLSKKQLGELFPLRTSVIDGEVKTVRKLYDMEPENCYTITEICKKYKVNDSTVYTQIRKYGIPTRQIGNYVYVPKSEIVATFIMKRTEKVLFFCFTVILFILLSQIKKRKEKLKNEKNI